MEILTNEALTEQSNGNDVEHKEVEHILSVLFKESCNRVILLEHPVSVPLPDLRDVKAGHSEDSNKET